MIVFRILIAVLFASFCNAQITVVNTGTSSAQLTKILQSGSNYLIVGYPNYLTKCYNNCDTLMPLVVPALPSNSYFYEIDRPDTNTLYLTAGSTYPYLNLRIYKSSDGGYNWIKRFDTVNPSMFQGASVFFNSSSGICFVDNWKTITTETGLNTYTFGVWGNNGPLFAENCGDSSVIVAVCGSGCGWTVSHNRGKSWTGGYGSAGAVPLDIEFLNKDTLFCLDHSSTTSSFVHSFDGGLNWNAVDFVSTSSLNSAPDELLIGLCVRSKNEIYVTARTGPNANGYYVGDGIILRTNDMGKTWSRFVTPFQKHLYDMKFLNDSVALICGEDGLLFKWNTKTTIFTSISKFQLSPELFEFFPNPVDNVLHFSHKRHEGALKIEISDMYGRLLQTKVIESLNETNEIELSFLPAGVYTLMVRSNELNQARKFIKR
jgi:photosystem II stability/assembly factor-like uncharacterized protein